MRKRRRMMLYKLVGVVGCILGSASFFLMPMAGAEYQGGFLKQVVFSVATCLILVAGLILSVVLVCWSRKKMVSQRYNPWESRIYWPSDC